MCVSGVCLCVCKLCVSKSGGEAGGGARRKCTTKNKNPTQRCGEQCIGMCKGNKECMIVQKLMLVLM